MNPAWAGLFVFLIAMSESLLVVGLIVPGTVLMFGVGTLVGAGVLGFWETFLWAFLGAIIGDGVSFWIGYFFSDQVTGIWPFRKKPHLLDRAQTFFLKHGGKSILFGRFVGPVRPIIPAVAGMMKMSPLKFTYINIASAIGWAPANLIPGIVFGTSLGLASQVTTRLAVLILAAVFLLWLGFFLIKRLVLFVDPRAEAWLLRVYGWSLRHPVVGRLATQVLDPKYPPTSALLWWALFLVLLVVTLVFMLHRLLGSVEGVLLDKAVFEYLQHIRFSSFDHALVFVYELGDFMVLTGIVAVMMLWNWRNNNGRVLFYWSIVYSIGMLSLLFINSMLDIPRAFEFEGPAFGVNFPSWHATMPIVTFGFLVVLLAEGASLRMRWLLYGCSAVLAISISLSGLILGAHWVSDVVVGFCFGLLWVSVVAMALRRRPHVSPPKLKLAGVFLISLFALQSTNLVLNLNKDVRRYVFEEVNYSISYETWLKDGWKSVAPPYRYDMLGKKKQAFTMQWVSDEKDLVSYMNNLGWQQKAPITFVSFFKYFAPDLGVSQLPVLPNLHNGLEESLIFTRQNDNDSEYVMRFWPSRYSIDNIGKLYIGNISLHEKKSNGLLVTRNIIDASVIPRDLLPGLNSREYATQVRYDQDVRKDSGWDGSVWLVHGVAGEGYGKKSAL
ncbi:MAG: VTT domain-containing protein [Gammaproteobacteria bacterium]|nr:VTT domain-containing protein [Gammaproteobacteria bacterium]